MHLIRAVISSPPFGCCQGRVCVYRILFAEFGFESHSACLDVLFLLCRAKFSVQVRDYVDLCVTRIADLGQAAARRRSGPETGHDRSPGVEGSAIGESSHRHGDCGDPTTREVRCICYESSSVRYIHCQSLLPNEVQEPLRVLELPRLLSNR